MACLKACSDTNRVASLGSGGGRCCLFGILRLAFVDIELLLDSRLPQAMRVRREFCLANFTDSENGYTPGLLHDPKFSFCHAISFPQRRSISQPGISKQPSVIGNAREIPRSA